jgi:phage terminase large subunit
MSLSAPVQRVTIDYAPRPLQTALHQLVDTHRWSTAICHRRFGKTVAAINHLQKAALLQTKPHPRYAYIAPTYSQGKAIAWDYMRHYAKAIPGVGFHASELRVDYPNGGQVRIYGANNPDALRGIYLDGVVLDEYGLMTKDVFSEVIRPALSDREGWALFMGTPNGKNQFYDVAQEAQVRPGWGYAVYKASETGVLPQEELRSAREQMTSDEYAQEYECSFEAAVKGSIYGGELETARSEGRITSVPYDPALPCDSDWDLGVGDSTAIWFSQSLRTGEVRLIDYVESSGEGFPYYANVLKQKGYLYGTHWAPHDIAVMELGTGKSRLDVAKDWGIKFEVTPRLLRGLKGQEVEEGISAARLLLGRCWFDAEKCKAGLESLQHYRRDYNQRLQEFKAVPVHDWASHGSDAFRGLAVRHQTPKAKTHGIRAGIRLLSSQSGWSWR